MGSVQGDHLTAPRRTTRSGVLRRRGAPRLAAEGAEVGQRVQPYVLDVSDGAAVRATIERIEAELGPIGMLANVAGILRLATVDTLDDVVDANDGRTSLREALAEAAQRPGDVPCIMFDESLKGGTINLSSTLELNVASGQSSFYAHIVGDVDGDGDKDITISGDRTGNGRTSDDVRIMNVGDGAAVRLDDITLADGYDRGADAGEANVIEGGGDGVSAILSREHTTWRSPGSFNSQVGVALSLL
ncbi:MAG: SDR family NAD(P)-dependent oxidoreductase, partial [Pseudomonadota bacterium]